MKIMVTIMMIHDKVPTAPFMFKYCKVCWASAWLFKGST